ncbi:alpha/beta fold hydrolase [Microlunatus elymi]|uniref:Alpha/beta fold hydrolase n=1 Tax=Microlunatus elymi TaxID=2596828 RepID=A0A516Q177_9ACTN|nr:alpha/beta hydrolase [Microlunatus elymi]QDP97189.1 alpha/beta fold hydrolase [Microlunatus elymi]
MSTRDNRSKKSTTVRIQAARLAVTRRIFLLGDRVAPGPLSRWALDLWCTLPGNAGRRRDERPKPGQRSAVIMNGRAIAVETWGTGSPIYLMHGWGGWRGQLGAFVGPLLEAGHRVVAFDAPSHGDSDPGLMGKGRGNGLEFAQALTAVAAVHGRPEAVIAHSFGCATAAVAIRDGLDVGRLLMIAPNVQQSGYLELVGTIFGFGPRTTARLNARIEQLVGGPLAEFDLRTMPDLADRVPTMIIHDQRDKEAPYADAVDLAVAWPNAEFVSTDGLGHQRILRDADVIKRAADFATAGASEPIR